MSDHCLSSCVQTCNCHKLLVYQQAVGRDRAHVTTAPSKVHPVTLISDNNRLSSQFNAVAWRTMQNHSHHMLQWLVGPWVYRLFPPEATPRVRVPPELSSIVVSPREKHVKHVETGRMKYILRIRSADYRDSNREVTLKIAHLTVVAPFKN